MFFTDKSEVLNLNFHPRRHCFSKARVEWNNIILNGTQAGDQPIIDLSQESLTEVCFDLYGPLSFIEIFELYHSLKEHSIFENMDWSLYFKLNQRQWNQRTEDLINTLASAPPTFTDWSFERKLSPADLMPLLSLSSLSGFESILEILAAENPGRSEARLLLDWLVDLHMMEVNKELLIPVPGTSWIEKIKAVRFPETTQRDSRQENNNPWPQFVHVVKRRNGDRIQRRMQIDFSDSSDLKNKLNRIVRIENHSYE